MTIAVWEEMFLTSGFQNHFVFEKSLSLQKLDYSLCVIYWTSFRYETGRQRQTYKSPFIGWLRVLLSLLAYVEFLYAVVLHVQSHCLLARNLRRVHVRAVEQNYIRILLHTPQLSPLPCSGYVATLHLPIWITLSFEKSDAQSWSAVLKQWKEFKIMLFFF